MTTLHTLNTAVHNNPDLFARLLRCASHGDSLLLIEDGVYNLGNAQALTAIDNAGLTLYCLEEDVSARGVQAARVSGHLVDDDGFVRLACCHHKVVSWCH